MDINLPNAYLVITSSLFIIPTTLAAYYRLWLEYSSCILLALISSVHHSTRSNITFVLDQFACYYLAYVFYLSSKKIKKLYIWMIGVSYSISVYNIGKIFNIMSWDKNYYVATLWHISMHLVILILTIYVINKNRLI
jgi:hypothetical protein